VADQHQVIVRLAGSARIAACCHLTAEKVRGAAARIDPRGDFEVEDTSLEINGLRRRVSIVRNVAPDAARTEFGRVGLRPLGRAARSA